MLSNKHISVVLAVVYDVTAEVFNFHNFLCGLDIDKFLRDPTILPSNCHKSLFYI